MIITNIVPTPSTPSQVIFLIVMLVIILGITIYSLVKYRDKN